jgi:hypothetical protein
MYDKLKKPQFQDEVLSLLENTYFVSLLDFLLPSKASNVVLQVSVAAAGRLHGLRCAFVFGVIVCVSLLVLTTLLLL